MSEDNPVTAERLKIAQLRVQHNTDREERDALVMQALAEDWSHDQIAQATGLHKSRINQIKRGRR